MALKHNFLCQIIILFSPHLSSGPLHNVSVVISVCCHSSAGICNRVCGGGAWLHIQGKGKHCLIALNENSISQVKLRNGGSNFAAFGYQVKKKMIMH